MKRLVLLILLAGFALPAAAQQSWTYTGTIPSDTLRRGTTGAYITDVHGLAVDDAGNIWVQSFRPIERITLSEPLQINSGLAAQDSALAVTGLYCLKPDGTSCGDFSPLLILKDGTGANVDTLGLFYRGVDAATGNKKYETMTGRGLGTSITGDTLYASFGSILYAINTNDGTKIGSRETFGGSLSSPSVTRDGTVYTVPVVNGAGIAFSGDLSREVLTVKGEVPGIGRSGSVTADGLTYFVPRFTTNRVLKYSRDSIFSDFGDADTVLVGLASESSAIHPTNGMIYFDSGAPARVEANNTALGTNYQPLVWYGFAIEDITSATPNPAPKDSIVWASTEFQRDLAFSRDGETAYAGGFDSGLGLAVYSLTTDNSITQREEMPTGIAVHQNAPNPFSGETTITFELTQAGAVTLAVYDMLGREVAVLVDDVLPSATFDATFDASNLPTGTYVYRLTTEAGSATGSMTVLR